MKPEKAETSLRVKFVRGLGLGYYEDIVDIDSDETQLQIRTHRILILCILIEWNSFHYYRDKLSHVVRHVKEQTVYMLDIKRKGKDGGFTVYFDSHQAYQHVINCVESMANRDDIFININGRRIFSRDEITDEVISTWFPDYHNNAHATKEK